MSYAPHPKPQHGLGLTEAHDAIVRLLDAPDPATRAAALRALQRLWEPSDFERVVRITTMDSSESVGREAAWVLYEHADAQSWRALVPLWHHDPLARHRMWAARLVGRFGSAADADLLDSLRTDVDGHVRKAAEQALAQLRASGSA